MNDLLTVAILGIVEGITEFLPISSTGHLIVASKALGFKDSNGSFELVIQLGAVLAVIWFYRRSIYEKFVNLKSKNTKQFIFNLAIAFVPAGILGFLFGEVIKQKIFTPTVVGISLIIGGIVLWLIEQVLQKRAIATKYHEVEEVRGRDAFKVGLAQIFALIPGVSRSGSTIIGGLLAKMDRQTATSFSFYLSIPTLGIATLYGFFKDFDVIQSSIGFGPLIVGLITSFITASLAINWLLRYISSNDFKSFAIYRVIAGVFILLFIR